MDNRKIRKEKAEEKNTEKKKALKKKPPSTKKLKLLFTVVNRSKGEFYADLIQSFEVNMQMLCLGQGTAKPEMMHYLGLVDSDKTVILSVVREDMVETILSALGDKFESIKDGKGIAFTVPLTSIIGVAIYGFLSNYKGTPREEQNG